MTTTALSPVLVDWQREIVDAAAVGPYRVLIFSERILSHGMPCTYQSVHLRQQCGAGGVDSPWLTAVAPASPPDRARSGHAAHFLTF